MCVYYPKVLRLLCIWTPNYIMLLSLSGYCVFIFKRLEMLMQYFIALACHAMETFNVMYIILRRCIINGCKPWGLKNSMEFKLNLFGVVFCLFGFVFVLFCLLCFCFVVSMEIFISLL